MSALRSLAFGTTVILAMALLLATNLPMWAFSSLLEPSALATTATRALQRPEVRARVADGIAQQLAPAMLAAGPLPADARGALDLTADRPTQGALEDAVRRHVGGLLADPVTDDALALVSTAIAASVIDLLEARSTPIDQLTADGLVVDLRPFTTFLLESLDPAGELSAAVDAEVGRVRLVDPDLLGEVMPSVRLLDGIRWALPAACAVVIVLLLLLARYRVHALAWVGLACVVAGTASLVAATGAPVVLPPALGTDPPSTLALTGALEEVTSGLVTQSAVLAGLGLALVIAGIAGGIVVSQGRAAPETRYA
jgi:hypothetical protein